MDWNRRAFFFAAPFSFAGANLARAKPKAHFLRISAMAFEPPPAGLRVGDEIEWINSDGFRHTATARNGDFDLDLMPGRRGRTVLHRPGAIDFYCRYHPSMRGRLDVRG
jgi:plastocyanin